MGQFAGFCPEAFTFLMEVRLNNSKVWFEAHRSDYQRYLLEPFKALVAYVAPAVLAINPDIQVIPAVSRTISRIRRDTRFTKDKSLYRDTMWFFLRERGHAWLDGAGFYFEISPVSFAYGAGIFGAFPRLMAFYRRKIDDELPRVKKLVRQMDKLGGFVISGPSYQRTKGAHLPAEVAAWYDKKAMYLEKGSADLAQIMKPSFAQVLAADFTALAPAYAFFDETVREFRAGESARNR